MEGIAQDLIAFESTGLSLDDLIAIVESSELQNCQQYIQGLQKARKFGFEGIISVNSAIELIIGLECTYGLQNDVDLSISFENLKRNTSLQAVNDQEDIIDAKEKILNDPSFVNFMSSMDPLMDTSAPSFALKNSTLDINLDADHPDSNDAFDAFSSSDRRQSSFFVRANDTSFNWQSEDPDMSQNSEDDPRASTNIFETKTQPSFSWENTSNLINLDSPKKEVLDINKKSSVQDSTPTKESFLAGLDSPRRNVTPRQFSIRPDHMSSTPMRNHSTPKQSPLTRSSPKLQFSNRAATSPYKRSPLSASMIPVLNPVVEEPVHGGLVSSIDHDSSPSKSSNSSTESPLKLTKQIQKLETLLAQSEDRYHQSQETNQSLMADEQQLRKQVGDLKTKHADLNILLHEYELRIEELKNENQKYDSLNQSTHAKLKGIFQLIRCATAFEQFRKHTRD